MEVRVGKRVADVELVSKDGNKVQLSIDGNLYDALSGAVAMLISCFIPCCATCRTKSYGLFCSTAPPK